ncbi:oligosaccharyl transferase, archaeosortase A system-associated [Halalkalicoccus sp. NIPERK01]|uniref:oligosaccharyl transferase, archaeosortase A system-associated n=1 Tax=Halalkalicoccus sp. NIPERK01 TaxID=3053469 RepID=UPI00256EBE0B|nr:oligosaccharyl transferase, archaeosortase A system-associated [Halalkalicoccus sp. NIPERK01]MDL5360558.1 oligosaccharyl transferase, archaeosortase A system-associated [Halalkalicoccus sp. NIPERK01]
MSERTEWAHANYDTDAMIETMKRWYHVPVLSVLVAFMLWVRVQAYEAFVGDGGITLSGVDPWYHYRTTTYTVENWPRTMPYETFTNFPYGASVGHFGTLFDQLIATAALLVGLGDPSVETVNAVFVLAPAVMGALVAVPTYLLGARLGGRFGGLSGVLLLALFPGTFLRRSTVGFTDHHVAETLFMALAVLALGIALRIAERDKPVYEQLETRDFVGLRSVLLSSALAGFAVAAYVWVWPSGVLLIAILGVFFVVAVSLDYAFGESPDHVAFVGATGLSIAGVLLLFSVDVRGFAGSTTYSLLQPALAFAVAGGCVFLAWLARRWERRALDDRLYPAAVGALVLVGLGVVAVALPGLFDQLTTNLARVVPIGATDTTLTIAEAQPPENATAHMFSEYGLAFFTAMAALAYMAAAQLLGRDRRADHLLIVVWSAFLVSSSLAQVRFNYYLAVAVAVLNAYLVGRAVGWAGLSAGSASVLDRARGLEGYQAMVLVAVALVLLGPLVPPLASGTVVAAASQSGPGDDALTWEGSNEWLSEHTPPQGTYGGAGDEMALYGAYEPPEDGDYDYPEGAYGVLSWWDYGHLIAVQGERASVANPFQQNARAAAAFFLADDERRSELLLEALPAERAVHDHSDEELRGIVDGRTAQQGGEEVRYVMIDDAMAGGKFSAMTRWSGPEYAMYLDEREVRVAEGETATLRGLGENYEATTLSRLYYDDASGMEGYRLVHESPETTQFVTVAVQNGDGEWRTVFVNREYTLALQYRLQQLVENPNLDVVDTAVFDVREESAVKTYERVEGATLVGEAGPGETVTAQVELTAESSDRTFTYTQETTASEDGSYELTVPYPTEEGLGPEEGYTDSDVVAEGEYTVTAGEETTTAEVPEEAVYAGETVEVEGGTPDEDGPADGE